MFLMLAVAALNWGFGLLLGKKRSKGLLALCVALNLASLVVFKYAGFLVENCNALFGTALRDPQISLPIGISFYTFQALSYSVDVYRKDVGVQRSYWKFLLYVSMFPQLIAGPIVRYVDVAAQIESRESDPENVFRGVTRFCVGLGKKVLLADHVGQVADQLLGGSFTGATTLGIWLGALMYMFQIYFDFSGYSDMAIGLGPDLRVPVYGELQAAVYLKVHFRILETVAHFTELVFSGLCLHTARRQPQACLSEPLHRLGAHGPLARRELELCAVGTGIFSCCCVLSGCSKSSFQKSQSPCGTC